MSFFSVRFAWRKTKVFDIESTYLPHIVVYSMHLNSKCSVLWLFGDYLLPGAQTWFMFFWQTICSRYYWLSNNRQALESDKKKSLEFVVLPKKNIFYSMFDTKAIPSILYPCKFMFSLNFWVRKYWAHTRKPKYTYISSKTPATHFDWFSSFFLLLLCV